MLFPKNVGSRISLYFMFFWLFIGGIHIPFWQYWLKNEGLSPSEVGLIIGIAPFSRPFLGLIIAWLVDRYGSRKWIISGLSFASAAIFSLYPVTEGLTAWLIITLIWAQLIWSASSLVTSMTTVAAQQQKEEKTSLSDILLYTIMSLFSLSLLVYFYFRNAHASWIDLLIIIIIAICCIITIVNSIFIRQIDYGRLRLWGTIGTVTGITYISYYLFNPQYEGSIIMMKSLIVGMVLLGILGLFLPDIRTKKTKHTHPPIILLLRYRPTLLLLLIAILLQGSHGMLYSQGSNYWIEQGIDFNIIGKFWSFGNISELLLFTVGWIFRKQFRASYILCIAALIAAIRWALIALYGDQVSIVFIAMSLHGFTYALGHLGAIYWIEKHIPDNLAASMQTLYTSTVFGLGIGSNMILSGFYYEYINAQTSWMIMSLMAILAAFFAFILAKIGNEEQNSPLHFSN